jgi:hypothetical protein
LTTRYLYLERARARAAGRLEPLAECMCCGRKIMPRLDAASPASRAGMCSLCYRQMGRKLHRRLIA